MIPKLGIFYKCFRKTMWIKICMIVLLLSNNLTNNQAQNTGPFAPEAAQFEPVDATDMVNLLTGDFSYVLPLLEVPGPAGGYPVALSYHAGVTMDQEASWVGLGWNINVGAINRSPNFIPDDWFEKEQFQFFWDDGGKIEQRSVGIFVPLPVSVGLDFAWGSHKGMGGYNAFNNSYWNVGAQVGFGVGGPESGIRGGVSASVGSNGYSVGVFGSVNLMGNVGMGGSISGGSAGFTANVGLSDGISSVGVGISKDGVKASASLLPISISLPQTSIISEGDYTKIKKSSGFNLIVVKYSHSKTRYYLFKLKQFEGSGILGMPGSLKSNSTTEYITDANVVDFGNSRHSLLIPATDIYNVSGQGIGGNIEPIFGNKLNLSRERIDVDSKNQKYVDYINPNIGQDNKRLNNHFEFLGENAGYYEIEEGSFSSSISELDCISDNAGNIISGLDNPNGYKYSNLKASNGKTGSIITYYANNEISGDLAGCVSRGFKESESIVGSRNDDKLFDPDGIGAFSITTADGKTYHYSLPVYQFEKFDEVRPESDFDDFTLNVSPHKYATSWLLTAITGPDYVDNNMDGIVNIGDVGYWVCFNYGKWTDGYMWQSPYFIGQKRINNSGNVMLPRSWGRKQIYYLDEIITASHTAYFFKSKRGDGKSRSTEDYALDNYDVGLSDFYSKIFNKLTNRSQIWTMYDYVNKKPSVFGITDRITNNNWLYNHNFGLSTPMVTTFLQSWNNKRIDMFQCKKSTIEKQKGIVNHKLSFEYNCDVPYMVKPLKLDCIVLVENKNRFSIDNASHYTNPEGKIHILRKDEAVIKLFKDKKRVTELANWEIDNAFKAYSESPILLSNDISSNITNNAIKIIDFDYDVTNPLMKGAEIQSKRRNRDGLINDHEVDYGKLTLSKVNFGGLRGNKIMPPYIFDYYRLEKDWYDYARADSWGFDAGFETGYHTGSKTPKYDELNKFQAHNWSLKSIKTPLGGEIEVSYESDSYYNTIIDPNTYPDKIFHVEEIEKSNRHGFYDIWFKEKLSGENNFRDFFNVGDVFSSYFYAEHDCGTEGREYEINITGVISHVFNNYIEVNVNQHGGSIYLDVVESDGDESCPRYYASGSYNEESIPYGSRFTVVGINDAHPIEVSSSKLKNKNNYGGGIRVAKISLKEHGEERSSITYNYNLPGQDITSGVTMLMPSNKDVDYKFGELLPGPGVMYGNVAVRHDGINGKEGEITTHFSFDLPEPISNYGSNHTIDNIFEHNLVQGTGIDDYEDPITRKGNRSAYVKSLELNLMNNNIGRILEKRIVSSAGDIVSIEKYNYKPKGEINVGTRKTTFKNVKEYSAFFDKDGFVADYVDYLIKGANKPQKEDYQNIHYYHTLVSIKKVPSILESTELITQEQHKKVTNKSWDYNTGNVLETEFKNGMGDNFITEVIPAYTIPDYASMGSKDSDINNANMLTQSAASYLYKVENGENREVSASIQTWNSDWTYRTFNSKFSDENDPNKIWRKHKSFVWEGDLDENGLYNDFVPFDWSNNANNKPNGWKNSNSVTRYSRYSIPLEEVDIRNNYSAAKLNAENRVIAKGQNAKYTEFCYTGFEDSYDLNNSKIFGAEVIGNENCLVVPNRIDSNLSHTGNKSYQIPVNTIGLTFNANVDLSKNRSKEFRVMLWVNQDVSTSILKAKSGIDLRPIRTNKLKFGSWYLLYADFEVSNKELLVTVNNNSGKTIIVDDFKVQPIDAAVTSYVYDSWGQIKAILNTNNLATRYDYNSVGQLKSVYKETPDGFKKIVEHEKNIKNFSLIKLTNLNLEVDKHINYQLYSVICNVEVNNISNQSVRVDINAFNEDRPEFKGVRKSIVCPVGISNHKLALKVVNRNNVVIEVSGGKSLTKRFLVE